jgi:hypothetical protein
MALRWQTIPIPFGQGLAQEAVPSLLAPGKLAQADNGYIDKQGGLEVRPGFQALPSDVFFEAGKASSVLAIHRLIGHNSETLLSDGHRLYSYSEGEAQWRDVDHAYEATVTDRITGERGRDVINSEGDCAYCNGYYVQSWYNSVEGKIHVRFVDASTGTRMPDVAWDSSQPYHRMVVTGNKVHVLFWHDSYDEIWGVTWDTTDLESPPIQTQVGVLARRPGIFDACSDTVAILGPAVYLAYNYGSDSLTIRTMKLDDSLALIDDCIVTANCSKCMAIHAKQGYRVWVAYTAMSTDAVDGLCSFCITESTMSLYLTPTQIDSDVSLPTEVRCLGVVGYADDALVVYELRGTNLLSIRYPELRARWISKAGVLGNGNKTYRIGMLSRPIIHGGQPYVVGYYHERSHTHISQHDCQGYPNRFGYLLHVATGPCTALVED